MKMNTAFSINIKSLLLMNNPVVSVQLGLDFCSQVGSKDNESKSQHQNTNTAWVGEVKKKKSSHGHQVTQTYALFAAPLQFSTTVVAIIKTKYSPVLNI